MWQADLGGKWKKANSLRRSLNFSKWLKDPLSRPSSVLALLPEPTLSRLLAIYCSGKLSGIK